MRHHYWEMPIVIYLFLGGLGGGIMCWAMLFTQIIAPGNQLIVPLGNGLDQIVSLVPAVSQGLWLAMFVALVCLAIGCFFLLFELGQHMAFIRVWLKSTSIICWGARFLVIAMFFDIFWLLAYLPWPLAGFFATFSDFNVIIAGIAGTCIMVYTGVMLSTLKAHSFWATPALPVLFTISALSTACAAVMICAGIGFFTCDMTAVAAATELVRETVHEVDIVLGICEITVLLIMVLSFLGAGNTAANQVAHRWVHGSYALAFWGGMMGVGLVIPLAFNIFGSGALTTYVAPILVLLGGFLLRGLCVYSDDRAEIPGENKYFNRLQKDADFMHAWDGIENLY